MVDVGDESWNQGRGGGHDMGGVDLMRGWKVELSGTVGWCTVGIREQL